MQSTSLPDDAVQGVVTEMHAVWRETEALDHPPSDVAPPIAVAPKTTPGRQDVAGNEPTQKAKRPRVASPDRSASRACVASTGVEQKVGAASTGGRAHKYPYWWRLGSSLHVFGTTGVVDGGAKKRVVLLNAAKKVKNGRE